MSQCLWVTVCAAWHLHSTGCCGWLVGRLSPLLPISPFSLLQRIHCVGVTHWHFQEVAGAPCHVVPHQHSHWHGCEAASLQLGSVPLGCPFLFLTQWWGMQGGCKKAHVLVIWCLFEHLRVWIVWAWYWRHSEVRTWANRSEVVSGTAEQILACKANFGR